MVSYSVARRFMDIRLKSLALALWGAIKKTTSYIFEISKTNVFGVELRCVAIRRSRRQGYPSAATRFSCNTTKYRSKYKYKYNLWKITKTMFTKIQFVLKCDNSNWKVIHPLQTASQQQQNISQNTNIIYKYKENVCTIIQLQGCPSAPKRFSGNKNKI